MSIEAMKMALEALEWINRVNAMDYEYKQKARESLNAIYEALAEQVEQAPICAHGVSKLKCDFCKRPEQAQPVAWMGAHDKTDLYYRKPPQADVIPLYTTPPPRQHWVSLTDKQLEEMAEKYVTNCYFDTLKYARAVEAELKEKNFVPSKLEAD
jgi:hypothetical protein